MVKFFNITGRCIPEKHYMVSIEDKLKDIGRMVERGNYFVINRARQYGKTTTLHSLAEMLKEDYIVISLDFQKMSSAKFETEHIFSVAFTEYLLKTIKNHRNPIAGLRSSILDELENMANVNEGFALVELFSCLSLLCETAQKPVVLMIDEVDSAANNQVFLDFLAQLRGYYLSREDTPIFQSVILAGVYDIKNLKRKIRHDEEHKYNSPWNIAETFQVDMSLSEQGISDMLVEYEREHDTGMEVWKIAKCIYEYTSGYPFLVSYICKLLDERIPRLERFSQNTDVWTESGISEAVKIILKEDIPLFGSMVKQLDIYTDLRNILRDILFRGRQIPFSPDVDSINVGIMFGFLKEKNGVLAVANRMFEMRLLNMFITEAASESEAYHAGLADKNQFINQGRLDMDLVMSKFVKFYGDVFNENDERFNENHGREIFLMYLKPIINGVGNSYQESATRTLTRTDIIVDYLGEQYVIELKIWRGKEYNERGEKQLTEYLDFYHKKKGYLLSFNFNKKKETGIQVLQIGDKTIVEAVV